MEKQFCDYDTAKKLKELGYKNMCYGYYANHHKYGWIVLDEVKVKNQGHAVAVPLWQQVKAWLWEEPKIYIKIQKWDKNFRCCVLWKNDEDKAIITYQDSPLLAEKEGIKKAVEDLHQQYLKLA